MKVLSKIFYAVFICYSIFILYKRFISIQNNTHPVAIAIGPGVMLIVLIVLIVINMVSTYRFIKGNEQMSSNTTVQNTKLLLFTAGQLEKYHIFFPIFIFITVCELFGDFFYTIICGIRVYYMRDGYLEPAQYSDFPHTIASFGRISWYIVICLLFGLFWALFALWKANIMQYIQKHVLKSVKKQDNSSVLKGV